MSENVDAIANKCCSITATPKHSVVHLLLCALIAIPMAVRAQQRPTASNSKSALAEQSVSAAVSSNWEDEMRRQGVKRARIRVGVRRPNGAMEATILRVVYYSEYDTNCSEIRDHDKLLKIRASGLEEALGNYAIGETAMSKVVCSESCSNIPRFISQIDVMDYAPLVQPPAVVEDPISDDASQLLGDETGVVQFLASSKPTSAERRMALLASSSSTDDSCIVQSLLGAGADVNARGGTGNTPLMNAALFGYLSDMRALLLAGAKVNDRDTAGETALMMAARMGFVDGVKMLVEAGADPSIVSKIGTTALNLAVKSRHADVAELIRQSQAQHRQLR
jgi:hypothetical protein